MLLLLPFTGFLLLVLACMARWPDVRTAFLAASVLWGTFVAISTELVGLADGITIGFLVAVWLGINVALTAVVIWLLRRRSLQVRIPVCRLDRHPASLVIIGLAAGIILTEAIIALQAPPNTWDSMSYHMSRVAHWIQNRTVAFYPTHILRQNHQMPWAEYAIMHLQVLSGGDRFANMVQWFSMVGSVIGVSVIALELGGSRPIQWLSAIVCLTLPTGILQATSAKNDYVLSVWCVCLVVFLIRTIREPAVGNAALTGASLGLALLTKGTAYVYATPLLVLVVAGIIDDRRIQWCKIAVIVLGVAIILNAPVYARNSRLYGKPLGPGREGGKQYSYANERFTIPILVSNMVRNLGLHLTTPLVPLNRLLEKGIYRLLGNEVNNPASTWGSTSFQIRTLSVHEERAGNPHHLLLIIISAALVLRSRPRSRVQRLYVVFVFLAALSFCACLRWQPWHNRLHLPLFVLSAPIVALGVSTVSESRVFRHVFAGILMATAILWLVCNSLRPLVTAYSIFARTRIEQYFADQPHLVAPYTGAVEYLVQHRIRNVGLLVNGDDYEYPFWVLLQRAYGRNFRLEHVGVQNLSQRLATTPYDPEAVLATVDLPAAIVLEGREYARVYASDSVSVFRKAGE